MYVRCRRAASSANVRRAGRECAATRRRARVLRGSLADRAPVTTGPRVARSGTSTRASVVPVTEGPTASCRWTVALPAVRACRYRPQSILRYMCHEPCCTSPPSPQECAESSAGVWVCTESACAANPCYNGTCSSVDATHYRCSCPPGITGRSSIYNNWQCLTNIFNV